MATWWAFVRTSNGSFMRVMVQAPTQWQAQQQLLAQYGSNLVSEAAYDNVASSSIV